MNRSAAAACGAPEACVSLAPPRTHPRAQTHVAARSLFPAAERIWWRRLGARPARGRPREGREHFRATLFERQKLRLAHVPSRRPRLAETVHKGLQPWPRRSAARDLGTLPSTTSANRHQKRRPPNRCTFSPPALIGARFSLSRNPGFRPAPGRLPSALSLCPLWPWLRPLPLRPLALQIQRSRSGRDYRAGRFRDAGQRRRETVGAGGLAALALSPSRGDPPIAGRHGATAPEPPAPPFWPLALRLCNAGG